MSISCEVLVIGSGPGGYVAAIRASQVGKKVIVVEKEAVGGVCLNVGCIPSKALISVSEKYAELEALKDWGIHVGQVTLDFDQVQAHRQRSVDRLSSGVEMLLKANKVDLLKGEAKFTGPDQVTVNGPEGKQVIHYEDCIIATGSRPKSLPGADFSDRVLSSTEVLALDQLPASLTVIGGGVIGVELASVYANFGTKVTLLEGEKNLLPSMNPKLVKVMEKKLKKTGVKVVTQVRVEEVEEAEDSVTLTYRVKDQEKTQQADFVMVSIGRQPNTDDLGLDQIGLETNETGQIEVDRQQRTAVARVYAIGDIVPGPMLAHRASYEAKVAAEAIAGLDTFNDYYAMPSVVYSNPEIAVTGYSLEEAQAQGWNVKVASFQYAGNGRAIAAGQTEGLVNIMYLEESGQVVGGEIVGANASDLVNELTLAIEGALTLEDIALMVHPHPSFGEIVMEAAEVGLAKPIHTVVK